MKGFEKIAYKKILPYLIISTIATIIDFSAYLVFLNFFLVHFLIANIISLSLGISTKFSLNKLITFKERKLINWKQQFGRFLLVSGSGFILSNLILYTLVESQKMNKEISKLIAIGILFFYTFVMHNFYSFEK
ncbi:MAG: GtrA family protein [Candidatus Heimdallarchaeota archaeon]|nr:GtrA family protein [Candidatus Heimdallarchaeota archaeon]